MKLNYFFYLFNIITPKLYNYLYIIIYLFHPDYFIYIKINKINI